LTHLKNWSHSLIARVIRIPRLPYKRGVVGLVQEDGAAGKCSNRTARHRPQKHVFVRLTCAVDLYGPSCHQFASRGSTRRQTCWLRAPGRYRHSIKSVSDNGRSPRRWPWPRPVRISRAARQEADRRAGEQLAALLDEQGTAEVNDLLTKGKPVYAMRRVRELTGLRLIDAKRLVESLQR
jgi:hypothetical protein